jgi:hypothetical protein
VAILEHSAVPLQPPARPAYARRLCAPASQPRPRQTHTIHTPRAHIRTDTQTLEDVVSGCGGAHAHFTRGGEGNRLRKTREGFLSSSAVCASIKYNMTRGKPARVKNTRAHSCCYQTRLYVASCDFRVPHVTQESKQKNIHSGKAIYFNTQTYR